GTPLTGGCGPLPLDVPASALARPAAPARGLEELERLHVDEVLVLADDVGVAHGLEKLLRAVEVVAPDLDAAQALRHVAVGAGPGDDPVFGGEPFRLLV